MISGLLGILVFTPMEVSTEVMWCAKQPGNTHISYCFKKEKECTDFTILKKTIVQKKLTIYADQKKSNCAK